MSPWLAYLVGGISGIAGTFLAQWFLAKRPVMPLSSNARPCMIRVAGDTSFCQSCGAQWPVEDFAFCGISTANRHKAWLDDLLARASIEEKAETVLAARARARPFRAIVTKEMAETMTLRTELGQRFRTMDMSEWPRWARQKMFRAYNPTAPQDVVDEVQ